MARYVEGSDRSHATPLPECLDDYIAEDNPVRVVEAFVEELDLELRSGVEGIHPFRRSSPSGKTAQRRPKDRSFPPPMAPGNTCGPRALA